MLIALCQSTCSWQCSTMIMKRMKQATLFGFRVLNLLIIPCLSDWFASHHTLSFQEWFVQVNQRGLKQRILWKLHTQGGWLATQFSPPPPDQPLIWGQFFRLALSGLSLSFFHYPCLYFLGWLSLALSCLGLGGSLLLASAPRLTHLLMFAYVWSSPPCPKYWWTYVESAYTWTLQFPRHWPYYNGGQSWR